MLKLWLLSEEGEEKEKVREEEMGKGMDRERRREEIAGTGYPPNFQDKLKKPVG